MKDAGIEDLERLAALRIPLDLNFSGTPPRPVMLLERLLAFRIGSDRFAVRAADIAGVALRPPIVPLAIDVSALLGVASLHGLLVPVYSLAELLGYGAAGDTRWVALSRSRDPVAFTFGGLDGYLEVPRAELAPPGARDARSHVEAVLDVAPEARRVLSVPSLLEDVRRRACAAGA